MKIELDDGKYTYLFNENTGRSEVLRHGERWRDTVGDKFILTMAYRIEELESERDKLAKIKRTCECSEHDQCSFAAERDDCHDRLTDLREAVLAWDVLDCKRIAMTDDNRYPSRECFAQYDAARREMMRLAGEGESCE